MTSPSVSTISFTFGKRLRKSRTVAVDMVRPVCITSKPQVHPAQLLQRCGLHLYGRGNIEGCTEIRARRAAGGLFPDTAMSPKCITYQLYQTTFSANWICRAAVCVATIWPNWGLRSPLSKMACMAPPPVFGLSPGGAKLARFKTLNISARNCTLNVSEILGM